MGEIRLLKAQSSTQDVDEVLDRLRRDFVEGKVVGFLGVALSPDDSLLCYSATTRPITRLKMQGALAQLLHDYLAGEISTGGEG